MHQKQPTAAMQDGRDIYDGNTTKFTPYEADNVKVERIPVFSGFLISFMVDARGGAMRGCRHQGVRIIIPPRKASMPTRVTCRLVKKEKLLHPPPMMEGEGLASRLLEMGPVGTKFLGPVILEVPHFASMRGKEREVLIMRSDDGENWREHPIEATEEAVHDALGGSFEDLESAEDLYHKRITRILTTDFPQYFALVTRIREENNNIGYEGGMISSTVVPQVQAVFPEGALTKKIKVGLQAQPVPPDQVAKLLGNRVAVSPIVTVEPRRRKFHKPITLTIPLPKAAQKGMINQYGGDAPTLRLLCSITGGPAPAQWEDVTGTTPLAFVDDCVSFTTAVSARFWLMDCQNINESAKMATELYREAICVPYMSKFVVFTKRHDPQEAKLRCFCMTDDKMEKTLESQEHYSKVAESKDVEVLDGKTNWIEMAGNLVPVTKSGDQLHFPFHAFRENRVPFTVRVRDTNQDPTARVAFMKDPKTARGEAPQTPVCSLNIKLPDYVKMEGGSMETLDSEAALELRKKYSFLTGDETTNTDTIAKMDLRLSEIASTLQGDWVILAKHLGITDEEIKGIKNEYNTLNDQCLAMLLLWRQRFGDQATANKLERALKDINREDVIRKCIYNVESIDDDLEKAFAKTQIDMSGFDALKEELGPSRESTMERGMSLDVQFDEKDMMKESESAGEESNSSRGSVVENKDFTKDDDEIIPTYDETKGPVKEKNDDEKRREEEEKEDAYRQLVDQLDLLSGDADDYQRRDDSADEVAEDELTETMKEQDVEDLITKLQAFEPQSMDDRMSMSSDEGNQVSQVTPNYNEVAARLADTEDWQSQDDIIAPESQMGIESTPGFRDDVPGDITLDLEPAKPRSRSSSSTSSKPDDESATPLESPVEDVEEVEETLPDGTVIIKRIVTKGKSVTTYTSVVSEPKPAPVPEPVEPQEEPIDQDYFQKPDVDSDFDYDEETLPDGTRVRTRIVRTATIKTIYITKITTDGQEYEEIEERPISRDSSRSASPTGEKPETTELHEETLDDGTVVTTRVSKFKETKTTHVHRKSITGEVEEDICEGPRSEPESEEEDLAQPTSRKSSHSSSSEPDRIEAQIEVPQESAQFFSEAPMDDFESQEPIDDSIKVHTEVVKGEPETETDVQEYEETLPDGTVVKRKITKTRTTQDVTTRITAEGFGIEDAELPGLSQEELENGETIEGEPDTDTAVEEYEEVLPDGTFLKRKVIKTRTTQSITTKTVSDEFPDDLQDEEDQDGAAAGEVHTTSMTAQ